MAAGAWSVTPRDYSDVTVTDRDSTLSHDARDAAASHVKRDIADLDMPHATDEPACAHYNITSQEHLICFVMLISLKTETN